VDKSLKVSYKPEVNWRACAFTTCGFIGHRT